MCAASFHIHSLFLFVVAKNIWNNLLEPDDAKSTWRRFANLKCPTRDRPFLATYKNSKDNDQIDFSDEDDDDRDGDPDSYEEDDEDYEEEDPYGSNNRPFQRDDDVYEEKDPYGSNNRPFQRRKLIKKRKKRRRSRRSSQRFLFQNGNDVNEVSNDFSCDIL